MKKSSTPTSGYIAKENKNTTSKMILYPIIVALFKADKIGKQHRWLFINEFINKMHTNGRILFRHIKQWRHAHWHNMEEHEGHYVKWNNPD